MRPFFTGKGNGLREVQRVETDGQEVNCQEEVDARSPIVQLRRDLTHAAGVTWTWAIGRTIEWIWCFTALAWLAICVGASASLGCLKRLRTVIASDAKQRTENHPQGDDRNESETKHLKGGIPAIWVSYGKV